MVDLTYPVVVALAKAWFRVGGLRLDVAGTEHIPRTGGALLAINHVSYVDYVLAGLPAERRGRYTRFMAKREVFDHPVGGPVMRSFGHISVDRAAGLESMAEAERTLRSGEIVGIFPEGTISRSFLVKELKTGAVRIAAKAEAPLVPVVLWGTQRIFTKDHPKDFSRGKTILVRVGEPVRPSGEDPRAETLDLHARMSTMLDEAIRAYPADEQPPGSWWLPASYGGSAPTPDEADRIDTEERRRRAQRRAAKRG
jgi:1-acyl-sn-glycerol-3-phosphate acyltransferase